MRPLAPPTLTDDTPDARIDVAPAPVTLPGKLAGLSLPRQVFVLAIWPLLEQLLNVLVTTTDLVLAARLQPHAVALAATDALSVAGYIGWLIGMINGSVGVGATALIARAVGARHRRVANAAVGQALLVAVAAGFVIGGLLYVCAAPLGHLAGADGPALPHLVVYFHWIALATPAVAILFVGSACLRGAGDTRGPFAVMLVVNVLNIVASVLLTFGPAPLGGHGVAGIAGGTVISWYVGALLILVVLIRGRGGVRLRLIRLRPHLHTLRRLVAVAIPNLIESSGMWLGNFAVLAVVGALNQPGLLGSHMIAIRIESLSFLMGLALGIASATLAGQYLGAGSPVMARRAATLCWAAGVVLMSLLGLLFIFVPEACVRVVTTVPEHLEHVPPIIRIAGFIQFAFATYLVLSSTLRGVGDTRAAMLLTYSSTFLVRVPAAYVVGVVLQGGLYGIWLALCGELVIRGAIFAARFLHGGWVRVKV